MFLDSFSSDLEPGSCFDCFNLRAENQKIKQQIAHSFWGVQYIQTFKQIQQELKDLKLLAEEHGLNLDDLIQNFTYAIDKTLKIKSKAMVLKSKNILSLIFGLYRPTNFKKENEKDGQKQKKKVNSQERKQSALQEITQKKRRESEIKQILKEEKLNENQSTQKSKRQFKPEPKKEQKPEPSEASDACLPLTWTENAVFAIEGQTITKQYNDNYSTMCTDTPLPRFGSHKIKIQVLHEGTMAFGIVPAHLKSNKFIDDKKGAVKYLSFSNGGGLLNYCGGKIGEGSKLHIPQGQVLQISFNADTKQLKFWSKRMSGETVIHLNDKFKEKDLYFYLEMKNYRTSVRLLQK